MDYSLIDKALEILSATHDGDDLSPPHLKLLELAVNGFLNDQGKLEFEQLYQNAMKPQGYTVPWLHDIEHLTRDHQGFVRWKGHQVEHYDSPWCYSEEGRKAAEEVARRCWLLEYMGEVPTTEKVIRRWPIEADSKSTVRLAFPPHALEKLMDGYRKEDPRLLAILREFHLLAIHQEHENVLATWENEGGK
jgi:hypothetical protein